jgi:prolyl-tRNA editing enzyme YbaK/EbsC (Cys-tRNA(Pro) deacylase)
MSELDDVERDTIAAARRLGEPCEVLECDPEYADTAAYCERYGFELETAANTIIVASPKEPRVFAACVVLATTKLDVNRTVRKLFNAARMSFASAEDMIRLTGMRVGGVTVFGLPADLPLLIDSRVMSVPAIIVGSGGRHAKIKIAPQALLKLPNARVVQDLAKA